MKLMSLLTAIMFFMLVSCAGHKSCSGGACSKDKSACAKPCCDGDKNCDQAAGKNCEKENCPASAAGAAASTHEHGATAPVAATPAPAAAVGKNEKKKKH